MSGKEADAHLRNGDQHTHGMLVAFGSGFGFRVISKLRFGFDEFDVLGDCNIQIAISSRFSER